MNSSPLLVSHAASSPTFVHVFPGAVVAVVGAGVGAAVVVGAGVGAGVVVGAGVGAGVVVGAGVGAGVVGAGVGAGVGAAPVTVSAILWLAKAQWPMI